MFGDAAQPGLATRLYNRLRLLEQWYLMFRIDGGMCPAEKGSFGEFISLMPPADRYWADPHIVSADGRCYVFIEEFPFLRRKGYLSVMEMDAHGGFTKPVRVLERPYHLSYPFVFACGGRYFMVPETSENHSIELYECLEFPTRWAFKMKLMDGVDAVDTTLLEHEGKWWLFTALADRVAPLPLAKTYLFFTDDLFTGRWQPHPLNPIEPDFRKGRSAGRIFVKDGRLIRPTQVSTEIYGRGFDLREIVCLSESEYREETILAVRPDWGGEAIGTHTYASEGQLTMIDAFRRKPRFGLGNQFLNRQVTAGAGRHEVIGHAVMGHEVTPAATTGAGDDGRAK